MGGNIFGFTAKRFDKIRLLELESYFSNFMHEHFNSCRWQVIPYYFQKLTFGDLDILVESNFERNKFIALFLELNFINKSYGYKTNGVSTSFLTNNNEQIDIIFNGKENYNCALTYYSWNDMGTFLGKIVKSHRLTYGFNGLYADYMEDSVKYGEFVLTKDPEEIFKVFGWDYATYCQGFDTIEQIFDYVISLHNFEPAIYNFDESELISKRPLFKQFHSYLKSKNLLDKPRIPKDVINSRKLQILEYFGKLKNYEDLIKKASEIKATKLKFNGDIVKDLTGFSGTELGSFIKFLKSHINSEFILSNDQQTINEKIIELKGVFDDNNKLS